MQGFALARPPGSFHVDDRPSAIITLTEGGYLCIHSLEEKVAPEPFTSSFQAQPVETSMLLQVRCFALLLSAAHMPCLLSFVAHRRLRTLGHHDVGCR